MWNTLSSWNKKKDAKQDVKHSQATVGWSHSRRTVSQNASFVRFCKFKFAKRIMNKKFDYYDAYHRLISHIYVRSLTMERVILQEGNFWPHFTHVTFLIVCGPAHRRMECPSAGTEKTVFMSSRTVETWRHHPTHPIFIANPWKWSTSSICFICCI